MPSPVPNREDDRSPLLSTHEVWDDAEAVAKQAYKEGESKSILYLLLLTLSIGGLQIVWSVELSHGSPYLLSLGMSKALLAFVWIAGPLTGALVQPYIGIRSDNCRIPWGKRKPFMVVGGAATIVALLALAWVREIVGGFLSIFGVETESKGVKVSAIVLATILMYCLDFAINTVQAAIRAFIVDNAPSHQQESANAWASRLTGVGNILGYIFGYLDLPKILPFFGNTQFKGLCVIASISLAITLVISCLYIQERDPRLEGPPLSDNPGVVAFFSQVFRSIRRLPPQIRKVCEVQLCAWVGWFPFLFYITTYIGQLYVNPIFEDHPDLPDKDIDDAWAQATRIGTFALLVYAVTSFVASIVLPLLIVPTYKPAISSESEEDISSPHHMYLSRQSSISTISFTPAAGPAVEPNPPHVPQTEEQPSLLSKLLLKLQIPGLTLRRTWFISHLLFAACMFSTFFISTPQAATVVVALVGISWALTLWAPFAMISAEVSQRDTEHRRRRHRHQLRSRTQYDLSASGPETQVPTATDGSSRAEPQASSSTAPYRPTSPSSQSTLYQKKEEEEETVDQAGVILGIHNVSISCPQIFATLVSSAIFHVLQKPRGEPWDDSVGWVLRFGGCAALGAAWFTHKLDEGLGSKGARGSGHIV
ncbi:hypothetical protein AJ80_02541 [Polytolypa hystricis UAMH7299]|uniref:Sucrose transporter n=1 Tax=Polytolypa hystricis (strain UAMH7299) TaxID=1447883 RepID=A0A2B7YQV6_POLH7|nr:hypothetical protein AJ80_02541 [Polytolypa hystricis UAMH7299]